MPMSIKSRIAAAAAALALAGGAGIASAGGASAATPSCGHSCVNVFSLVFGTHHRPNFVVDVFKQAQRAGQPIILFRTSNNDPAEDFTYSAQGTVHDFFLAGLVSASLNLHYASLQAYELEYSPFGADTGLCVGVGSTAANGTLVTLQPCGVSAKTVWVIDKFDAIKGGYAPLINGSDTNFSHPFVLTYPQDSFPTDVPRPILQTENLQKFSNGTVNDRQMWSANLGVLP
jgi:hypothetical protein